MSALAGITLSKASLQPPLSTRAVQTLLRYLRRHTCVGIQLQEGKCSRRRRILMLKFVKETQYGTDASTFHFPLCGESTAAPTGH